MHRAMIALSILALALAVRPVGAADDLPAPEQWIAPDAVLVLKVADPKALLDVALRPELIAQVEASPAYQKAAAGPQFQQVVNLVTYLESRLRTDWPTLLRKLTGGGVTLVIGPAERNLLIIDTEDPRVLEELHEVFLFFAKGDAQAKGNPQQVASAEYRGVTGWSFGPGEPHPIVGKRLLLSNKPDVIKTALDLRADQGGASLAKTPAWQATQKAVSPGSAATLFVNMAVLKQAPGIAEGLRPDQNAMAALLFAPLLESLQQANWLGLGLAVDGTTLRIEAASDGRSAEPTGPARFAWPAEHAGRPPPLAVPRQIAGLSFYRDLHAFYAAKDELFPQRTSELIFFENMMGIFFTGRDLTDEVLAELAPETRFVVAAQAYDPAIGTPATQIPAFAAVFRMKDRARFAPVMEEAWQKALGLINFTRGQKAEPGMVIDRETYLDTKYTVATFGTTPEDDKQALDTRFNFSPTLAMPGEYIILSSTEGLARDLMDALKQQNEKKAGPLARTHSLAEIDGNALAAVLAANRENLVLQNMLDEGNTREAAEAGIGMLLAIVERFDAARLQMGDREGQSQAVLELKVK